MAHRPPPACRNPGPSSSRQRGRDRPGPRDTDRTAARIFHRVWVLAAVAMVSRAASGPVRVRAYRPARTPPWPPTYQVTESLLTMQCNSSGYSSCARAAEFGIVSYDWSNAKAQWAQARPMDCQERLDQQARQLARFRKHNITSRNNNTHIFVYRNIVKALPWYSSVRSKIVDPQYSGFFLSFDNATAAYHVPTCAPEDPTKCSGLYHDGLQTPAVPTPHDPHPDGACAERVCDCGPGLPCGEYYFDHRNGTLLREWLLDEVILGALIDDEDGNDNANANDDSNDNPPTRIVDGLFLDDYWCSHRLCQETNNTVRGCPCKDPSQGPTESDPNAVKDMGLSDDDVYEITLAWNQTMSLIEDRLLEHGAYTWWLMDGQENADASPYLFRLDEDAEQEEEEKEKAEAENENDDASTTATATRNFQTRYSHPIHTTNTTTTTTWMAPSQHRCVQILRDACSANSTWQTRPRLFGFRVNATAHALQQFPLDWAFFLLVRGPYAWAGWGQWGMTWPFNAEPAHGGLPPLPHGVPLPHTLTPQGQEDYGIPRGVCREASPGLFRRDWSHGFRIELDCHGSLRGECSPDDTSCHRYGVKHRIRRMGNSTNSSHSHHPQDATNREDGVAWAA